MKKLLLTLIPLLLAALLATLAAACGGGSDSTPTPAPTSSGPPNLSPEVGGVEAARRYLLETGIDGKRGDLSDPRSCAEVSSGADGEYCIQENFSTYAAGLVILRISKVDEPEGEVWEVRLVLKDKAWEVTQVEPFGDSE